MAKKNRMYTWIVKFSVDATWVADGFSLSDDRAHSMLAHEVGGAYNHELKATVLHAPSPLHIVRQQGYGKDTPGVKKVIDELINGAPAAKSAPIYNALVAARQLIDSVAFVKQEGDKESVLRKLDAALTHFTQPSTNIDVE